MSHRTNTGLGITGALLIWQECVIETLEGHEDTVLDLYTKIAWDGRHEACTLLHARHVDARLSTMVDRTARRVDTVPLGELLAVVDADRPRHALAVSSHLRREHLTAAGGDRETRTTRVPVDKAHAAPPRRNHRQLK